MEKYLTPEGLEKLKKELDYLKTAKRKEIAQQLKRAIDFGDLSENAAYKESKEAQGFLEGRIKELRQTIATAKIVEKQGSGWIQLGSKVNVLDLDDGEKLEFEIVGETETDPFSGKISLNSPLGKTLLNKPKGAVVKVKTPGGAIKYKILEIY